MNKTNDQVRTPSDYSRRGVGAGSWHVSQALRALLWGAGVIGLALWGAIELADWLLWGGL